MRYLVFTLLFFSAALALALAAGCGEDPNAREPACEQLILCCDELARTSSVVACALERIPTEDFACERALVGVPDLAMGSAVPDECAPTGISTEPPEGM